MTNLTPHPTPRKIQWISVTIVRTFWILVLGCLVWDCWASVTDLETQLGARHEIYTESIWNLSFYDVFFQDQGHHVLRDTSRITIDHNNLNFLKVACFHLNSGVFSAWCKILLLCFYSPNSTIFYFVVVSVDWCELRNTETSWLSAI